MFLNKIKLFFQNYQYNVCVSSFQFKVKIKTIRSNNRQRRIAQETCLNIMKTAR